MKMDLLFATHNAHKVQEIKMLLPKNVNLVSLHDLQYTQDIAETAHTLKENALLKAQHVHKKFNLNCLADDSGLEVEALNGAPGVHSARYAGLQKNDADNNAKLLRELQDKNNRNACFKTVLALIFESKEYLFEGTIQGTILHEKRGEQGFGYDPLFMPLGHDKTFAEMSAFEKNSISHRALAVKKLVLFFTDKLSAGRI
ncbi:MAG: non-canonical purine NTP diphosphatase [Bacteroidetes bacterium]|nr:non-canonical purine NTP diphosphatase [Bacteroidota bacterium]